jgi:calcineurin-like phosphoesterase family protein
MKLTAKNIWVTSDTHFSHSNLVRGETNWRDFDGNVPIDKVRDFDTTVEMNELMIKNINDNVSAKDWLIHLGDWSFGGEAEVKEFRKKINCHNIVLILGNHDHHIQRDKINGEYRKLFSHVAHYEELKITNAASEVSNFVLCHYPIVSWNKMHYGAYMLHGHQHLKGDNIFGGGKRMDVGLCGSPEFRPYHIEEIMQILNDRNEPMKILDHHIAK